MFNHAPSGYKCPICIALEGRENDNTLIRQSDIVYRDNLVTAFISSFFIGNNPGHVIIVPNQHFENIYDLPTMYAHRTSEVAQKIALALKKAYPTEGITTLQNNEPIGNQHAFHYHFHVFPRYTNDQLHENMADKKTSTPEERKPYADKVKAALEEK
ncbi:MAG: HIT family protein [Candidatus Levyibacteriota bacterium]